MFVGVLALAGLALVACEPLKPPPKIRRRLRADPTGVAGRMREAAREIDVGRAHGRGEPGRARVR
jgi:hypothetical protein